MPFASMTSEDVAAFYSLLDDYFESRQELFASWASARAPAAPAAAPSSSRAAPPSSSRTTAPPPPAVQNSYRPSTPASPPLASPAAAGSDGPRAPAAQNKYGVTVPSMSDFKDPRFQSAFKVAGTGMSKAGGLINKHVLGGQDHSKTNAGAGAMDGSAAGGAATPPPKAAKPGGFGGVNMGTFRDAAKGMQAMNQINRAFSPQSAEAPAAAAAAPPPPPPAPTGAALPPPSRTGAPPPARNGGIGSCTALYDYEAAEAGDLGFNEGDKITILSKESADWWRGSLHGREGLFPAAYVQQN